MTLLHPWRRFSFRRFPPLDEPIRAELFGIERLEQHAASLAVAQRVGSYGARQRALLPRVDEDAASPLLLAPVATPGPWRKLELGAAGCQSPERTMNGRVRLAASSSDVR